MDGTQRAGNSCTWQLCILDVAPSEGNPQREPRGGATNLETVLRTHTVSTRSRSEAASSSL